MKKNWKRKDFTDKEIEIIKEFFSKGMGNIMDVYKLDEKGNISPVQFDKFKFIATKLLKIDLLDCIKETNETDSESEIQEIQEIKNEIKELREQLKNADKDEKEDIRDEIQSLKEDIEGFNERLAEIKEYANDLKDDLKYLLQEFEETEFYSFLEMLEKIKCLFKDEKIVSRDYFGNSLYMRSDNIIDSIIQKLK